MRANINILFSQNVVVAPLKIVKTVHVLKDCLV